MKIVFACDVFYPYLESGGVVHMFQVARNLVKLGHDVKVICGRNSTFSDNSELNELASMEIVEGIEIYRTDTSYRFGSIIVSLRAMYQMGKLLKGFIDSDNADVCIPAQFRPCIPIFLFSREKIPCLTLWFHTSLKGYFFGLEGWLEYPKGKFWGIFAWLIEMLTIKIPYEGFITLSESSKKDIEKYTSNSVYSVSDGVDINFIDSISPFNIESANDYVVFLGRLVDHKNLEDAINSVKLAKDSINDLKLVVISPGGYQEPILNSYLEKEDFIIYLKNISDDEKYGILKNAKALLHPSEKEGFGLVHVESLACNTPYISYDIPIMNEMKQDLGGGILVPYKDIKAYSDAICLICNNDKIRNELSIEGRKNVENKYTWVKVAKKYEDIIENIIKNNKE